MANVIVNKEWLDNGLTDIADSIRAKTGGQEGLEFPLGMKVAVDGIEQGGAQQALEFWARNCINTGKFGGEEITEIPNLTFPICVSANSWLYENKYITKIGNIHFQEKMIQQHAQMIFRGIVNLITMGDITFDLAENLYYCCANNTKLEEMGKVICPNALLINYLFMNNSIMKRCGGIVGSAWVNAQSTFYGCKELEEIVEPLDFSSCTGAGEMFRMCTKLKEVRFVTESIRVNIGYLDDCKELSPASVQSVIDGLADLTGDTAKILTFHADVKAKLTEEQIIQITSKNWTLA